MPADLKKWADMDIPLGDSIKSEVNGEQVLGSSEPEFFTAMTPAS
jgi:hypothetical protein